MAFREVSMLEVKEVLRRWRRGEGKKSIGRQVRLDAKTVRRYIAAAVECGLLREGGPPSDDELTRVLVALQPPLERAKGDSWKACEGQRSFIEEKLSAGLKLSKVRRLLQRRQVTVPYPTLHRYAVSELGFGQGAATIPVADCEPGQEVQLDTGWMTLLEPDVFGKRRRFRAWIFTSVFSRHRFVYPVFPESTATAIEACEAAWEFFGGVFAVVIPDNTKAIVQRADPLNPLIILDFLEYSQARDFTIDPTRVRSPKDKGRVERAVQPTRDDCFAGETLQTLDDARRRGVHWSLHEYGMRRHSRTQRMPLEHFDTEEKAKLRPAPTEAYDLPLWTTPKVGNDQHAIVEKAFYSLPPEYRGKKVTARADRITVRFYNHKRLSIWVHGRQPPGGRSTASAHFPAEKLAYANRDRGFLLRQAEERGKAVGEFARGALESPRPWASMRHVYALLGLCKRYGDARVNDACALAVAAEMFDAHRLGRMLAVAGPPPASGKPNGEKVVPLARYLRPATQYALNFPGKKSTGGGNS